MSKFTNPISGAFAVGIGGAIGTSIGAAIQKHNVHDETVTALVGGVITGAIAGLFTCFLPRIDDEDSSATLKIVVSLVHASLSTAAGLTAPLMGEVSLQYGTQWKDIIVDELIGGGVMLAAAAGVVALACIAATLCSCELSFRDRYSRLSFFSNVGSSDPIRQPIIVAPPNPSPV